MRPSVRNGLLPAAFVFTASTRQDNLDISATIGLYPGINSSAAAGVNGAGLPAALQTPGIDARQEFLTFGDKSWGTVKMGRDIGIVRQGRHPRRHDPARRRHGRGQRSARQHQPGPHRGGLHLHRLDSADHLHHGEFHGFTASVGAFTPLDDGNLHLAQFAPVAGAVSRTCGATRRAICSPARSGSMASLSRPRRRPRAADAYPATFCVADNNALRHPERHQGHRGRWRRQDRCGRFRGRAVRLLRQGRRHHRACTSSPPRRRVTSASRTAAMRRSPTRSTA